MSGRVEIKELTKIFAHQGTENDTLLALDDICINVTPGEFLTLLGASGCGKSTLLRIIAGLEIPTKGNALFEGERIQGTSPNRGLVFQEHTLFAWLTVRGNIEFALKASGLYKKKKK